MKNHQPFARAGSFFVMLLALSGFLFSSVNQAQAQNFKEVDMETVYFDATKCTRFAWAVKFKVDGACANGGWIVQKIKFNRSIYSCEEPPVWANNFSTIYYEAWEVKPNKDTSIHTFTNPSGNNHNDVYLQEIPNPSRGKASWQGTLAFIENPTDSTSALDSTWGFKKVQMAGNLWSTYNKPSFWDAMVASGKTKKHNAYIEWICCGDSADTLIYDTTVNAPVATPVVVTEPGDTTTGDTTIVDPGDTTVVTPPDSTEHPDNPDGDGTGGTEDPEGGNAPLGPGGEIMDFPLYLEVGPIEELARDHRDQPDRSRPTLKGLAPTFTIYPVPFEDRITIASSELLEKELSIRLINIAGQEVLHEQLWFDNQLTLDVSELPSGIYLMSIESLDGSTQLQQKVIK